MARYEHYDELCRDQSCETCHGCTDVRCTRINGRCVGMHCARCGEPCSSQGHACKEARDE